MKSLKVAKEKKLSNDENDQLSVLSLFIEAECTRDDLDENWDSHNEVFYCNFREIVEVASILNKISVGNEWLECQ